LKFINHEEGRIVTTGSAPEYQYHLKDHLGNVRMTFTTKDEIKESEATYEPANYTSEVSNFLRVDNARKVQSHLFDMTNGAYPSTTPGYAQRLAGTQNEKYGLAKSLSVMPGDTIRMEVFAKYVGSTSENSQALNDFISSIMLGTAPAGVVVDGGGYSSSTSSFTYGGYLNHPGSGDSAPMAYLNYIMFDRDFNPILTDVSQSNFVKISTAAKETGGDGPHERLFAEVIAKKAGYLYIYLSNDNPTPVDVFFDNFKVEHVKSPIVQMDDYYPFGLAFNSYQRENSTPQNYLYNGKELQDELNLGWYDYQARQYDPAIGRWMAPDPLSDLSRRWSPYTYCYNNPLLFVDPDGMFGDYYDQKGNKVGTDGKDDGKVYVVTDKKEISNIKANEKSGGTTQLDQVSSAIELPSAGVRAEMGNAVDRSNAPNASVGDTKGGFHEEGGVYGLDANGNQVAAAAQPGEVANPQTDTHADIDVWSGDTGNVSEAQGTYHVHPSGEVVERPPANTIGPTTTHGFGQGPSDVDVSNAQNNAANPGSAYHTTGNNYVLGAKSGTVSIYNQNGTIATFTLKQFRQIGN
jgi:RHS repeat-associated protein